MKQDYKNKQTEPAYFLDMGRLPPQSIDLEEAVLGALMLEKNAFTEIADILQPECFYKDSHAKIYRTIQNLSITNKPIDVLTVAEELKKNECLEEIGGAVYLVVLTNKVISAAHVEIHARIVAQKYIQRELIRVTTEIQQKAYSDSEDVKDLLEFADSELFKITNNSEKKDIKNAKILVRDSLNELEKRSKNKNEFIGLPSGFTDLDRVTLGWQGPDLIVIAARPSIGKTSLAIDILRNLTINFKKPTAFFSLEMSSQQIMNRIIISETEINANNIKTGQLSTNEWDILEKYIPKLINAPFFIDDTPAISLFELRAKCRRLRMKEGIELVIVDYLQLMTLGVETKGNREQEVSAISRGLKAIAKELDIPVIALSQLNRAVESRGGSKRPNLSDLRESGAIEQDTDIVIFIHRPEKYGITEDEDGNSTHGLAEIIIAKHRNGACDNIKLRFRAEFSKFVDYSDKIEYQSVDYSMSRNNNFDEKPF